MPKNIITGICLFSTLALGVGLIWPKYQEFADLKYKILQRQDELKTQEDYLANLESVSQRLKENQENLLKIDSALPDNPSLPSLFNFLQGISAQSGLILKGIGPATFLEKKDSQLKELHSTISLSGSYSALKNFLNTLESSARLIEVENISFSSPPEDEPFDFNLKIKVYFY